MTPDRPLPPLTLPPDQMRRLGYQVVDLVADALAGLRDRPPSRRAGPEELAGLLHEPVPRAGGDPEQVLRQAVADVLGPAMRVDHPRFFAYVPIPSNYVGMLADALVAGFGVFAGTWQAASGAAAAELAALCRAEGLWVHVDGAFGAPVILTEGGRQLLAGIEWADSLALDAHKWLFQPLEAGCVLVRDVALLESIFSSRREFLLDAAAGDREVNFTDRGLQLTRSFRAFKLWLSLKVFGLDAFAAAVQHGLDLAGYADALLRRRPSWEVVAPTRLALVTFRHRDRWRAPEELEAVNRRVADAMLVDDLATLSSTVLGGHTALRLCTVNPRTTREDVEATLARVEELAATV